MREMHLAEKGTLDGYEQMMTDLEQQMRERFAGSTDTAKNPRRKKPKSVTTEVVEYETLEEMYLAEKGTLEGFEEMMAHVEQQLRERVTKGQFSRNGMQGTVLADGAQ